MLREDDGDGDRGDDEGEQHAHAPERRGAQVLVEEGGDHEGDDQLRDRGEQEDAQGVEDRVPEERVAEDRDEVAEADELALALEQVPVVQRDTNV